MFLTFFVCNSFLIFIMVVLLRGQITHDAGSGFPPKGVSGSPPTGLITARSKFWEYNSKKSAMAIN